MIKHIDVNDLYKDDINKIFSEINQIINQTFQLTISAITVFGVFIAWIFPKHDIAKDDATDFLFAAPVLLLTFLLLLFLYTHFLNRSIVTLATYLRVTKKTKWEDDFILYRGNKAVGYSLVQKIIFLILGILTTGFPYLLYHLNTINLFPLTRVRWTLLIAGATYILTIVCMSFLKPNNYEKKAFKKWKAVLNIKD